MTSTHPKRASAGSLLKKMYAEEQEDCEQRMKACCAFDLTEFSHISGFLDGTKCCTKCGSTRTPQWREGPYGAKTLCNACGVKRTRKLRAEQEGTMKKPRKSPQKRPKQAPKDQRLMDPVEFRSGYLNASRSGRAAAQESAYRTHKYAVTGEWANMPPMFKVGGSMHDREPSSSDNVSAPLSDMPEEIAYMPYHGQQGHGYHQNGDHTARTSDDCFAAINLMTMSAKSSLDDTFFSSHGTLSAQNYNSNHNGSLARTETPESSPTKISGLTPSNSDVEAALAKISQMAGGGVVIDSNVSALSQSIPPSKVSELIHLTEELEFAQQEVQAAGVSVSTMASILAAHQANLLQKQIKVSNTTEQLQRFVFDLESKFGLTYKVLPRINVKPEEMMR